MRKLIAFIVAASVFAIWAGAASACNTSGRGTNTTHYNDGFSAGNVADTYTGIDATIYQNNPYVYTGCCGTSFSSAWVGLDNANYVGQTGYENRNGTRENWAGVGGYNSWVKGPDSWSASPLGSQVEYKVTYSGGTFHIFFNGNSTARYNYGGFSEPDNFQWLAEAEGEINTKANQMPGTANNLETFGNLQLRFYHGGSPYWGGSGSDWHGAIDTDADPNWYKFSSVQQNDLGQWYGSIWDTCQISP